MTPRPTLCTVSDQVGHTDPQRPQLDLGSGALFTRSAARADGERLRPSPSEAAVCLRRTLDVAFLDALQTLMGQQQSPPRHSDPIPSRRRS